VRKSIAARVGRIRESIIGDWQFEQRGGGMDVKSIADMGASLERREQQHSQSPVMPVGGTVIEPA
jgi:hypothetical protein